MLPHSFLGIVISLLIIVGLGYLLNLVCTKFKIERGQYSVAYYAFLIIIASIHPLGALFAFIISIGFIIWGKNADRAAGITFISALILILILGFIFNHAVFVIPLRWR